MNRLKGILTHFDAQEGILRLCVRLCDDAKKLESQMLNVLLLEDSTFLEPFLQKTLKLCFKESSVIVGLELKGLHNTFKSKILDIQTDTLFARLVLEVQNSAIAALCPLDFIKQNALKKGDCVKWHIPENAVMLYA
ncbi:molybdate ABC transporter [Helicobacter sp.]|uniref:molybdate ABC transporter n=1 Tax=Helicobacter sp. TaxID=218 RepID=UPI0025C611A0|nr:molybdate ABC transporter [Helicobacter sp.]MCI5969277.1 molybdate ABC transporter [Helicobacter sp.]MDY2585532.1 molybdate ABC transporter [Helicobacter sp.]